MKKYLNYLLATAGLVSLGLGILGIFLPVLPTTPFVLLSAWLFLKSSKRLHQRLLANAYFGPMIINYQVNKSISLRAKTFSLSLLWLSMLFTVFFCIDTWIIRIVLLLTATAVTYHILSFKTHRK